MFNSKASSWNLAVLNRVLAAGGRAAKALLIVSLATSLDCRCSRVVGVHHSCRWQQYSWPLSHSLPSSYDHHLRLSLTSLPGSAPSIAACLQMRCVTVLPDQPLLWPDRHTLPA